MPIRSGKADCLAVRHYALGIEAGADPTDEADLPFVYEEGLKALPSMAVVLGYPGFWLKE